MSSGHSSIAASVAYQTQVQNSHLSSNQGVSQPQQHFTIQKISNRLGGGPTPTKLNNNHGGSGAIHHHLPHSSQATHPIHH